MLNFADNDLDIIGKKNVFDMTGNTREKKIIKRSFFAFSKIEKFNKHPRCLNNTGKIAVDICWS